MFMSLVPACPLGRNFLSRCPCLRGLKQPMSGTSPGVSRTCPANVPVTCPVGPKMGQPHLGHVQPSQKVQGDVRSGPRYGIIAGKLLTGMVLNKFGVWCHVLYLYISHQFYIGINTKFLVMVQKNA